jgi:hypothetical protein
MRSSAAAADAGCPPPSACRFDGRRSGNRPIEKGNGRNRSAT